MDSDFSSCLRLRRGRKTKGAFDLNRRTQIGQITVSFHSSDRFWSRGPKILRRSGRKMTRPVGRLQASFELFVRHLPFELFRCDAIRQPWRRFGCDVRCVGVQTDLPKALLWRKRYRRPFQSRHIVHFIAFILHWSGDHFYLPVRLSRKFNCECRPLPGLHKATKYFVKHSSECARRLSDRTNCGMFAEHSFGMGEISVFKFTREFLQFGSNFMQFNFINSTLFATLANHKCKF